MLNRKGNRRMDRSFFKMEIFIPESHFPELKGKLAVLDVWTPATYKRYTGAETGSFMSFAFSGGAYPKKLGNRVKGVKNLILATQWLRPPGGLPPTPCQH